ncbi:hypothetical protein CKAH01_08886 [Colletotrichum kahawae]|uniref:Uncharacterized protein n=1 Tax=Colletotrichum kahawae TaxID=34407 RepID=A0AAE0CZI5_COLKA|nr:hypothetical protein CKAH01_08886 [Colletotrichum kahawae]
MTKVHSSGPSVSGAAVDELVADVVRELATDGLKIDTDERDDEAEDETAAATVDVRVMKEEAGEGGTRIAESTTKGAAVKLEESKDEVTGVTADGLSKLVEMGKPDAVEDAENGDTRGSEAGATDEAGSTGKSVCEPASTEESVTVRETVVVGETAAEAEAASVKDSVCTKDSASGDSICTEDIVDGEEAVDKEDADKGGETVDGEKAFDGEEAVDGEEALDGEGPVDWERVIG